MHTWTPIALEAPTLRTRTVLTPWFSYTSSISALLFAHRQLRPIIPSNGRRQVLQVPRNAFHFSVPYTSNVSNVIMPMLLELPIRVLHTPVAAILCLNLIPLLTINNQPNNRQFNGFFRSSFVIARSIIRILGRCKRQLLHTTSRSGQPFPSPSVYSDCSSGDQ